MNQKIDAAERWQVRIDRYEATPKAKLASELARNLFGEKYKADRAAMNTVSATLTRLRKGELYDLECAAFDPD